MKFQNWLLILLMLYLPGGLAAIDAKHEFALKPVPAAQCDSACADPNDRSDYIAFGRNDSVFTKFSLSEEMKEQQFIVEFITPPLATLKSGLAKQNAAAQTIAAEHANFLNDINTAESNLLKSGAASLSCNAEIKTEFNYVFNGLAVKIDSRLLKELSGLPYVKNIYRDDMVYEANMEVDQSSEYSPLKRIQHNSGLTGKGVIVSVIDSGIDYTHPGLGAGMGPNHKVIGGYDFVDDDSDPRDERGHGTHVAGIIAAECDSVQGIAPDVKLLAFRVINNSGAGHFSWVIKAIERSLDPDENPLTDDQADIINMSLGGKEIESGPICTAANNACVAGSIVVASAGNNGTYQQVHSPSTAPRAISVGAGTQRGGLAYFSSKGPVFDTWELKPDILAPGVDILSTYPGNGYRLLDGTSMAAPYVAGVAALLRQKYPTLSVETLKSLLLSSAKDIGEDICSQGNGLVDIQAAVSLETAVYPAKINFGFSDLSMPTWQYNQILQISNLANVQQDYALSWIGNKQAGISIQIIPDHISLGPSRTGEIKVVLTVKNNQVPNATGAKPFEGKLSCRSQKESMIIPFAFYKLPRVQVTLDDYPYLFYIFNKDYLEYRKINWLTSKTFDLRIPVGIYDIMAYYQYSEEVIIKENVEIKPDTKIFIKKEEIKNKVTFNCVDKDSIALPLQHIVYKFMDEKTGHWLYSNYGTYNPSGALQKFSSFSRYWRYEAVHIIQKNNPEEYYSFPFCFHGLTGDTIIISRPSQYKHLTHIYHVDTEQNDISIQHTLAPYT